MIRSSASNSEIAGGLARKLGNTGLYRVCDTRILGFSVLNGYRYSGQRNKFEIAQENWNSGERYIKAISHYLCQI